MEDAPEDPIRPASGGVGPARKLCAEGPHLGGLVLLEWPPYLPAGTPSPLAMLA